MLGGMAKKKKKKECVFLDILEYLYICISRPGRRPLGFLSLICSKNSLESDEPTQVHSKKRLKPLIPVSRQNLKRSNPLNTSQEKTQESSDLPSPSVVVNTQPKNIDSSATQVCDNYSLFVYLYRMGWISDSTRKNMAIVIFI